MDSIKTSELVGMCLSDNQPDIDFVSILEDEQYFPKGERIPVELQISKAIWLNLLPEVAKFRDKINFVFVHSPGMLPVTFKEHEEENLYHITKNFDAANKAGADVFLIHPSRYDKNWSAPNIWDSSNLNNGIDKRNFVHKRAFYDLYRKIGKWHASEGTKTKPAIENLELPQFPASLGEFKKMLENCNEYVPTSAVIDVAHLWNSIRTLKEPQNKWLYKYMTETGDVDKIDFYDYLKKTCEELKEYINHFHIGGAHFQRINYIDYCETHGQILKVDRNYDESELNMKKALDIILEYKKPVLIEVHGDMNVLNKSRNRVKEYVSGV